MASEENDVWEKVEKVTKHKSVKSTEGLIKGTKMYSATTGHNYRIKINPSTKSCQVSVLTKGGGKNPWVFRLDGPHKGVDFNHININPKYSNMGHDPHLKLPTGGLTVGKGVARLSKAVNTVNKVLVPIAITLDAIAIGKSGYDDYKNKTTRNTVSTAAAVAGGWGVGYGGALGGAAIGTAIFPGIGTIVGGIIGGITGGITGSLATSAIVDEIGDLCDYDIVEVECKECGKKFKIRIYQGMPKTIFCPECDQDDD